MWAQLNNYSLSTLIKSVCVLSCAESNLMNEMLIAKLIFIPDSLMFCVPGRGRAPAAPHFDSRSRIFELHSCGVNGKVCLVYKNCTTGDLTNF